VQLYPAPSDSATDIDYRYYAYLPEYTSDDNAVNLDVKVPIIMQPALYFGLARLYKQEKGDYEGSNAGVRGIPASGQQSAQRQQAVRWQQKVSYAACG
jgi:hypothetical protein